MSSHPSLHYDVVPPQGDGSRPWLYMLHGIFGAGRNWRTIARRVAEAREPWGAVLVDLRLHGRSPGFEPPHTLAACADDLERLAGETGLAPSAVLGHSFGGKVALSYLSRTEEPGSAPRQAWIVDSTPSARPPSGSAYEMLRAVRALPKSFPSRGEAAEGLVQRGFAELLALWMTTNLERTDGGYVWRLDFGAIEELLQDFFRTDLWPVVERPPGGTELHFIGATRSDVLDATDRERIQAAGKTQRVYLHSVEGGHWLNAENPDSVVRLLERYLPEASAPSQTGSARDPSAGRP